MLSWLPAHSAMQGQVASEGCLPAVQLIVAKLKEKDPAVASSVSKVELMVSPCAACGSSRCALHVQRSLPPAVERCRFRAPALAYKALT